VGYSIWLYFQGQTSRELETAISSLARRFSTPKFEPHLTLVGDIDLEIGAVKALAARFAALDIPMYLPVCGVDFSDRFFMALYLAVEIPPDFQNRREQVASVVNPGSYKLDDPHVSLLYGAPDRSDLVDAQRALAREFDGKFLEVCDVGIVHSSKTIPISDWKRVASVG